MSYSAEICRGVRVGTLLVGLSLAASSCHRTRLPDQLDPGREEKVNIGYGTVRRQDVTGAVSSLGPEELVVNGAGRLHELLQSKLPGVRVVRSPGGEISLRIRGDGDPLILIDGAPLRARDLHHVNPYDVHRVDILRDAASTAIYGVQGANGVILISTKRPR